MNVQNIHEELAEYINTPNWNRPIVYYDDDDDEDYTIAITPVLSTKDPLTPLIMEDEHLDTILATESDKVIKSSVENLVQIPSESEARFGKFHYRCGGGYFDNPTKNNSSLPNVIPPIPPFIWVSDFTLSSDSLGSDLVVSFPSGTRNKIFDPGIFIGVQSMRFLSLDEFSISFIRDLPFPVIDAFLPFLPQNEDKVSNPGILCFK
ncbi:hypothetical protein Tco_1291856 [Tanacetum coccineum]